MCHEILPSRNLLSNRAEFSDTVQEALQDMLDAGPLGSAVISLSYAFRNAEDNRMITGWQVQLLKSWLLYADCHANSVQASYNEKTGLPVTKVTGDEFNPGEDYWKEWVKYGREKLPRMFLICKYHNILTYFKVRSSI